MSQGSAPDRLRIVHLVPGSLLDGAQRSALELAKAIRLDPGFEVRFCVLGQAREGSVPRGEDIPIDFVDFAGRIGDFLALGRSARRVRMLLRQFAAHIVHSHLWPADIVGALAAARLPVVQVCHIRDSRSWQTSPRLAARVRRLLTRCLLDRRKVHFVAVSDGAAEYASHAQPWIAGRISTIRNGIDLSRFLQVPNGARRADHDEPVVLGAVGRLTPEKGYDCLLRAAAALRARGLRFVLRIAGTGSSLPACKELVRALDIGESVRFEGRVEDMAAFYRDIDLLVLPSPGREGLPRCIMEVLASGKPAIATRVPGNIEALEDRRQGLLVPPGDPQALAEAMERLARDPDLRLAMGNAGRARACELFDVNRVAREVKTLYRQLIGCRVATETKGDLPPFVVHGDFPRIARVAYGQEDERRRLR